MDNIIIKFWTYIRLKKEEKKNYYKAPTLVCRNCQRVMNGYILKGVYISSLQCPICECYKMSSQKEIK
jgi:rubrerythrin